MWVLSPLVSAASQRAAEEGSLPNPVQFLTSGSITVGRPAKKGGTTGKADMLIFGEQSVSSLHAELEVQQLGLNEAHGTVTIKDLKSKFGTFVRRSDAATPTEQKLDPEQPVQLQPNDIIRFGTKCRYQLMQIQLNIYPSRNDMFLEDNAAEDVDWIQAGGWLHHINARIVLNFNPSMDHTSNSQRISYCIAAERGQLTPVALAASTLEVPLVTPAWLEAVAAKKVHAGSLPHPEGFAVKQLLVPSALSGQRAWDVSSWQRPAADFLAKYVLLFPEGYNESLAAAARCLGAQIRPYSEGVEGEQQAAAVTGKAVLTVMSEAALDEVGSDLLQPQVTERDLLEAILHNSDTVMQQAVDAWKAKQKAEAERQAAAHAAATAHRAPAAAKVLATVATASGSEDATEEGTDDGDEGAGVSSEPLQPVVPVVHNKATGRQAKASPAKLKGKSATPAAKSPLQLKQTTPKRGRASKRSAEETAATAAAAVASPRGGKPTPAGRKRRKLAGGAAAATEPGDDDAVFHAAAAAAAPPEVVAPHNGQPAQQQQQHQWFGAGALTAAAASHAAPAAAQPAGTQLVQLKESIFTAPLVLPSLKQQQQHQHSAANQNGTSNAGVNFKAFRRKQQAGAVQPVNGHQQQQQQGAGYVIALVPEAGLQTGADVDAFLREEQQRQERLKKADELFNATLKPVAKAAAAKTAAAKPPRGRTR